VAKARILVVEDERIIAAVIEQVLVFLGYDVAGIVDCAARAVESVAQQQPDVVLMDIRLRGEQDGIEAAVEIQERFGVPVVYLTAYADKAMKQRATVTGPCGYVIKPFSQEELRVAIEAALQQYANEGADPTKAP
jgi:CheY-like chemotaxis protein